MRNVSRFTALVVAGMISASSVSLAQGDALEGNWAQPCKEADESWSTAAQTYQGGNAAARYTMFEGAGCGTKMLETSSEGTYSTGAAGAFNAVDYAVSKITVTPFGEEMVFSFNYSKFCGIKTWRSGGAQDVTGKVCEGQTMGGNFYDIWSVEGDTLFHGLSDGEYDGKTPAKRPVALDRGTSLTRQ